MDKLDDKLAALAIMSPVQLRGEWLQLFKREAPATGPRLSALAIAYRLQERSLGALASEYRRELARLGKRYAATGELDADPTARLKPGTRLVRDWRGRTHQVLIRDDGYGYRDRVYASLTQIAREITGTNWSGPRFFGLKRPDGKISDGR